MTCAILMKEEKSDGGTRCAHEKPMSYDTHAQMVEAKTKHRRAGPFEAGVRELAGEKTMRDCCGNFECVDARS